MGSIKYPPLGYTYQIAFGSSLDDQDYEVFGNCMRSLFPELSDWPNSNLFTAWMDFGETVDYHADPSLPTKRDKNFLAFLYAEQELRRKGYFVREDGTEFTHYDLDGLDEYWAM
jgi:hypothetical protein